MKAVLLIDEAVGETRRLLVDETGAPFRLDVRRVPQLDASPRLGDVWAGRVASSLPGKAGWFVELGSGPAGVLSVRKGASFHEGERVTVAIRAEAWAGKGPLLTLASVPASAATGDLGRIRVSETDPFLKGISVVETETGVSARQQIDAAIEEALQRVTPLPGGGDIAIERSRALTAIDIDAGSRTGAHGSRFAEELNRAGAAAAARQISLRALGGLAVVDFLAMPAADARKGVLEHFRKALDRFLEVRADVLGISRFGLCELSIPRGRAPLSEALGGAGQGERQALDLDTNDRERRCRQSWRAAACARACRGA
ncbi:MAG: ribonuclease E/G [Hyphomonadaceae bacterium]